MAEVVVGLARQGGTLRAVALRGGIRRAEVLASAEMELAADAPPGDFAEAAANLVQDLSRDAGATSPRVVVGLDTSRALFRRLRFPFSDAAKIRRVLPLELEGSLPLAADDIASGMVLAQSGEEGQEVLAAAVSKVELDGLRDSLARAGVSVAGVDVCAAGLWTAAAELPQEALLLDLHDSGSTLVLLRGGAPWLVRALPVGNQDAAAMAQEVRLSLAAADVPSLDTPGDIFVAGALPEGLPAALGLALNQDVRPLATELEVPPRFVAALGLALRGVGRGQGFGLYATGRMAAGSGKLATLAQAAGFDVQRHAPLAIAVLVVLLLGFALTTATDIHLKRSRLEAVQTDIEAAVAQALPELAGRFTRSQYVSILRTRVRDLQGSLAATSGDGQTTSAVLARMVSAVPPELPMRLSILNLDENAIRIAGSSNAFGTVEAISQSLLVLDEFIEVNIRGAAASKDGRGVDFQLELVRNPEVGP